MSKFEFDIRKKLKKIHGEAAAKVRKLLKSEKIILIDSCRWDQPSDSHFKRYLNSAEAYLANCGIIKHPSNLNIDEIITNARFLSYTTKEELDKFKNVTWPKLYGKWLEAEKKRKAENREANANLAKTIRAKIAKLQKQLEELED